MRNPLVVPALCLSLLAAVTEAAVAQGRDSTTALPTTASSPPTLVVERIEILGATKTRPQVIHRYLQLKPGDVVTPAGIARDYTALTATHFFKQVDFSAKPGSAPGKVVLVIEVVERRWPWLEFAGGFSELEGWYWVPAGVRCDNLLGGGNIAGARLVIGDRTGGFLLHYRQPEIFTTGFDLQIEAGSGATDYIHYIGGRQALHKVRTGSATITLAGSPGWARHFAAGLHLANVRPEAKFKVNDTTRTDFPPALASQLAKEKINTFFVRLHLDTRDDHYFPRAGLWGALSFEFAGPALKATRHFNRAVFDGRWYHAFGNSVLALHGKAGRVTPAAPFYERFYLGGAYALRGFPERGLTPLGWGTELVLAQAEMRFPVAGELHRPGLMGAIFFDAGRIRTTSLPDDAGRFFTSAGFGFRAKVPVIGLLRMDFAYPLDRDAFRFHLALGQTF
ncbi:MAG: BamA/TamA family outer membrane protein [candidate division KSB1 bacterium]|nr:BamA/TamA family outer membrane protein [candidate division KSB1 bacterium]